MAKEIKEPKAPEGPAIIDNTDAPAPKRAGAKATEIKLGNGATLVQYT